VFIGLKLRQQFGRKDIPAESEWKKLFADSSKRSFKNSMLKILRMGALMKYIMQYPRVSAGRTIINSRECIKRRNVHC